MSAWIGHMYTSVAPHPESPSYLPPHLIPLGSMLLLFSCSVVSDSTTPWTAAHRLSCPSLSPRVCLNFCSLSWWCLPIISSCVAPVSSCPQSFQASGTFQMSQLFTSDGQSIGVSASMSVLPMNIQDWFPLGWTGWISLQSKGLSRVFSNTTPVVMYGCEIWL